MERSLATRTLAAIVTIGEWMRDCSDGRSLATRTLAAIVTACGAGVAAASVAAFAASRGWPLELLSHFRMQYCALLAIAVVALLAIRAFRRAAVLTLVLAANIAVIAPFYTAPTEPVTSDVSLRAMAINVNARNRSYARVRDAVQAEDPDLLVLLEVTRAWARAIRTLETRLPHVLVESREDSFGIAILSKRPLIDARILTLGAARLPSILAGQELDGRTFSVIATHPLPPISRSAAQLRDDQLTEVAELARSLDTPVLLLGDLNTSPWSPAFRDLLHDGRLADASRGRGVHATWPVRIPLMRIPIDHCLHSDGVEIHADRVGKDVGSDHYPLIVDFALRAATREPDDAD
jgi:endonuclease/exonuclease/phosphatase (EEP) superfamily protein YafD